MMSYTDYHDLYGESYADLMREEIEPGRVAIRDAVADLDANGIEHYIYNGELYAVPDSRFDDSTCLTGMTVTAFYKWLQEVAP